MDYLKSYNQLNEEVRDFDEGFELKDIFERIPDDPKDPALEELKAIARKGNLYKYLATGQRKLTFGMLKDLHADALKFKKSREYKQGIQKFLWRIIPLAFAPIFFPIWLISQALGATRALNKILAQVLKMENNKYESFIMNIINTTMEISEGEIQRFLEEDWFYRSFAVEKGLINMVRKEHIIEFSYFLAKRIKYQDDLAPVPPYFVENEFRRFLNRKFRLDPPLLLKKKPNKHDKYL